MEERATVERLVHKHAAMTLSRHLEFEDVGHIVVLVVSVVGATFLDPDNLV